MTLKNAVRYLKSLVPDSGSLKNLSLKKLLKKNPGSFKNVNLKQKKVVLEKPNKNRIFNNFKF